MDQRLHQTHACRINGVHTHNSILSFLDSSSSINSRDKYLLGFNPFSSPFDGLFQVETKKSNHSKDLGETPLSEAAGTFGFTTWKTLKKQNDKESVVDCDVGGVDSGVCTCVAGKISKKPWRIGNPIFMGFSPWSGVELHLQEQLAGSTWRSPDLEWSCLLSLFTIRDYSLSLQCGKVMKSQTSMFESSCWHYQPSCTCL